METLNHVGRQEIGVYSERSFNDDPNIEEFYGQYTTGDNTNEFTIFLHIKENPTQSGSVSWDKLPGVWHARSRADTLNYWSTKC